MSCQAVNSSVTISATFQVSCHLSPLVLSLTPYWLQSKLLPVWSNVADRIELGQGIPQHDGALPSSLLYLLYFFLHSPFFSCKRAWLSPGSSLVHDHVLSPQIHTFGLSYSECGSIWGQGFKLSCNEIDRVGSNAM